MTPQRRGKAKTSDRSTRSPPLLSLELMQVQMSHHTAASSLASLVPASCRVWGLKKGAAYGSS